LKLYQRSYVIIGQRKYVLSTAQDVIDSYEIYKKLLESTRTGTEQRILDFYEKFVMQQSEWRVSELTTEYNAVAKSKRSDYTIRSWLERLNEIGYVDKRNDPTDKRANLYIPLVTEKFENALNSENQTNLKTALENGFDLWKKNICKMKATYYKNIFEKEATTLEALESIIAVPEKIFSVFRNPLFKYPDELKEEPKNETKPKDNRKSETQVNSHNLEDLVSKTKSIVCLTSEFTDKCLICGFEGRMDWQATFFDGSWGLLCGPCGDKVRERIEEAQQ
jgi:hypothetical protein